jgi:hypothetical protein
MGRILKAVAYAVVAMKFMRYAVSRQFVIELIDVLRRGMAVFVPEEPMIGQLMFRMRSNGVGPSPQERATLPP